ncbi:MAG: biopolymer transporter ExbD [Bacteroidetes bacterium]|jgi:biopolymer transport protein ExbD|nr:biopolymer transporter ExbD [Bacteroidota bacterium]
MPKIKIHKGSPSIDMTPMVDLAFLLVTFFMLTASFRMAEPVVVDPPSSHSDKLLPENTILITIDNDGRPFFGISNAEAKMNTLKQMSENYKVKFTPDQLKKFGGLSSFGVDIKDLPKYLDATEGERKQITMKGQGIPNDSASNHQLHDWILIGAQQANTVYMRARDEAKEKGQDFKGEKLRYAIKADGKVKYVAVKAVFKTFTDMELYTFNLITSMEGGESAPAKGAKPH